MLTIVPHKLGLLTLPSPSVCKTCFQNAKSTTMEATFPTMPADVDDIQIPNDGHNQIPNDGHNQIPNDGHNQIPQNPRITAASAAQLFNSGGAAHSATHLAQGRLQQMPHQEQDHAFKARPCGGDFHASTPAPSRSMTGIWPSMAEQIPGTGVRGLQAQTQTTMMNTRGAYSAGFPESNNMIVDIGGNAGSAGTF